MSQTDKDILYQESQGVTQWWIWFMFFIVCFAVLYKLISSFLEISRNNDWSKLIVLSIPFIILILVISLLVNMRLKTVISTHEIAWCYTPFFKKNKRIAFTEMSKISVIEYRPLAEFLGWGIRFNASTSAYTVKGNNGILIEFDSKRNILIGTQQAELVEEVLKKINLQGDEAI